MSDRRAYSDEDDFLNGATRFQKYKQVSPEIQTFHKGPQKSSLLKRVPDLVRSTENRIGSNGPNPEPMVGGHQLATDHLRHSGIELADPLQSRVSPSSPHNGTSSSNSNRQAESCSEEEAVPNMPSKWKLETANEQASSRVETQGKVLRNRRKMLKTSKVCSNVE